MKQRQFEVLEFNSEAAFVAFDSLMSVRTLLDNSHELISHH